MPGGASLLPPFLLLLLDVTLVTVASWLIAAAAGHTRRGFLEAFLAWGLSAFATVAAAGVVLGAAGKFHLTGMLVLHALLLAGLSLFSRRLPEAALAMLRDQRQRLRQFAAGRSHELPAALLLAGVLAALTALAALTEATVFDALAYHLPRVGHWLQEGKIATIATADERMNFVASIPEIVTAWLLMGSTEGFPLVVVPQALGGIMAVGATIGLARHAGLGRLAAVLAGALLLGMGNVVVQFTAAQTDLFTAGIFAAAFYLWLGGLARGEGCPLGGAGAGLALGAKGTLFYLAPSVLGWVIWLGWRHPQPIRQWVRTVVGAAVGVAWFAGPGFFRNWNAYGDVFGPRQWVNRVHGTTGSGQAFGDKLYRNLVASLAHNCDPNSQPWVLREGSRHLGTYLAAAVPERDGATLDGLSRQDALMRTVLLRTKPDADATSFGLVALLLFVGGAAVATARWRKSGNGLILVWAGGVAVFLIFYHAMQQWHQFGFRYFVLVAPWIAVAGAWGVACLPRMARQIVWLLVLAAAGEVAWRVTVQTPQAGWRSLVAPDRTPGWFVAESWRQWSAALTPAHLPLYVALEEERPVAGFYRQAPARNVQLRPPPAPDVATAEEFTRKVDGWIVVPAMRFLGKEGRVAASVWSFFGDERSPFSVAAYRTLRADESPRPFLYRHLVARRAAEHEHQLLLRTWREQPARLALENSASVPVAFQLSTPLRRTDGRLHSGERSVILPELPPDVVAELTVVFRAETGTALAASSVSVTLVP